MLFVRMPNILVRQCSYERSQVRSRNEQERSVFYASFGYVRGSYEQNCVI